MDILENALLAFTGLRANKMRTILTMLGIIIGISSVIAIVTIGNSVNVAVEQSMGDMGANVMEIYVMQKFYDVDSGGEVNFEDSLLTYDMIEAYKSQFQDQIEDVSLKSSLGSYKVTDKEKYANVQISGINDGYANVQKLKMLQGRFITQRDMEGKKKLVVVSDKFVNNMFGRENALGKEIPLEINNEINYFIIVGVYEYNMNMMGYSSKSEQDMETEAFIPITTANQVSRAAEGYWSFSVNGKTGINMEQFSNETRAYFAAIYEKDEQFGIEVYNMQQMLEEMNGMMKNITIAISAIAGISLLVGGIGVMNIMMVSITERTREIGTRKALGAQNSAIRFQFIVEAMMICLMGGIIGVILGVAGGISGAKLMGYPAVPSVMTILVAVGFSMLIGVFFGYYPANKAAKMNTIDALRYE